MALAVKNLTMFLLEGMWKILTLWMRKAIECCKWGLMEHPHRRLEDNVTESRVDLWRPSSRFQRGTILEIAILAKIWVLPAIVSEFS